MQARELVGGEIEVIACLRVEQPADLVDLACGVGDAGKARLGRAGIDLAEAEDCRIGLEGLAVEHRRRQRVGVALDQHPDRDRELLGGGLLTLGGHDLAGQQLLLGGAIEAQRLRDLRGAHRLRRTRRRDQGHDTEQHQAEDGVHVACSDQWPPERTRVRTGSRIAWSRRSAACTTPTASIMCSAMPSSVPTSGDSSLSWLLV